MRVRLRDERGRLNQVGESLLGAEMPGGADDPPDRVGKEPFQLGPGNRVGMVEPLGLDRVGNHDDLPRRTPARRTLAAWPCETQTMRSIHRKLIRSMSS